MKAGTVITLGALNWNNADTGKYDSGKINIEGYTAQSLTNSIAAYTFTLSSATNTIKILATNRIYLSYIQIN